MRRLLLLAVLLCLASPSLLAQSDSVSFSSSATATSPLAFARAQALLDSSDAIWRDLLRSLLQDTLSLKDSARASFCAVARSLDSAFASQLRHSQATLADASSAPSMERLNREQARLADATLALYDSLSRAFDALLPRPTETRAVPSADYNAFLKRLLEGRSNAHRVQLSVGYQSRSVWRGIDQNSGKGAFSLSGSYQHQSGFFFSASALGLQGQSTALDQASISLGIDYQAFDNALLSLAYARHYYSASSVQARSSINSDVTLWLSIQTQWLAPSVMLLWAIGDDENDFFCSWEISRAISLSRFSSGRVTLVPSVSGDYGTISTIRAFVRRARFASDPQTRIERSSPFVLTNYAFSLSLQCVVGNLFIVPEFLFVVPINVSSLTIVASGAGNSPSPFARAFKQGGSAFGYFSVQASYSL